MAVIRSNGQTLRMSLSRRIHSFNSADMTSYGSEVSFNSWLRSDGSGFSMSPADLWRTQPAVRTVVGFIARNVANNLVNAYSNKVLEDKRLLTSGPMVDFLGQPGPDKTLPSNFKRDLVIDKLMWGRYFAPLTIDNKGNWTANRIDPEYWEFIKVAKTPVAVRLATGKILGLDRCLWWTGYPSEEDSPIEALTNLLKEESESASFRQSLWKGGARIPGVLKRPLEADDWEPKQEEAFKEGWAAFSRDGASSGLTPVLQDGMEYEQFQMMSPADGQNVESRKLARSEVAAYFHVPPVYVGVTDDANYSNMKEFAINLDRKVLGPEFTDVQEMLNCQALPLILPNDKNAYCEFDIQALSLEERIKYYNQSVQTPWMTASEARRDMGLPFIEGTDKLAVNPNVAVTVNQGKE